MSPFGNGKRVVGIDWTGRQLRWVALEGKATDWGPVAAGERALSIEELEHGPERAKVTGWLAEVVRENRLRGARAVLGLPTERVLVRYAAVPRLPRQALRQTLEVEIGNTLHVPFERPVLDVVPVPPLGNEVDEGTQTACMIVTDRTLVETFAGVVHQAGLRPLAAEITPVPLWRLCQPNVDPQALTLWLSVDDGVMASAVCLGDAMYVLRTITDPDRLRLDEDRLNSLFQDVAYEAERVVNFFNFTLAGQEHTLTKVWIHAARGGSALVAPIADRLQRPVELVQAKGLRQGVPFDPVWYTAAGLALRGLDAS